MSEMKNDPQSQSETPHEALVQMRGLALEPSPFLAQRLQANLRANEKTSSRGLWGFAIGFGAVAAVIVGVLLSSGAQSTSGVIGAASYALNKPYMIRVDIRALDHDDIAYAEIELVGDSAMFASKQFRGIGEQRKIQISANAFRDKQYLPIVVEGVHKGETRVSVQFYDRDHRSIGSQTMNLSFVGGT